MSEPRSSVTGKADAPKKPVSPVRNIIGLVVLVVLGVVIWFEYSAYFGYKGAVNALNERTKDEDKDLMTEAEAEELIKKAPDGTGSDVQEGNFNFNKKTYTWKGVINTYTLDAYYTKSKTPALHHFEAGEKLQAEPNAPANQPSVAGDNAAPRATPKPGNMEKAKADAKEKVEAKEKAKADAEEKADDKKADDKKADDKKADDKKE